MKILKRWFQLKDLKKKSAKDNVGFVKHQAMKPWLTLEVIKKIDERRKVEERKY